MPEDYKNSNLETLKNYSDEYYSSYKEQFKTTHGYIIGISSSAIFAFFVLLQKMTSMPYYVILGIKICIILFLASFLILLITNIIASKNSFALHKIYDRAYKEVKKKKHNDDIYNVLSNIDSSNIRGKYIEIGKAINIAYFSFGMAVTIIACIVIV